MPEFYSKSFLFEAGKTYAIGATAGYTGALFPSGASAMDGVNALIVKTAGGATVSMVLSNTGHTISDLFLNSGTIYPFRPRVFVSTKDTFGLV